MLSKETYKIWAPSDSIWSPWVRPVPFIAIDKDDTIHEYYDFTLNEILYLNKLHKDTAIIIDEPGYDSIKEGIALAKLGYRPIPLFNGVNEQANSIATTNNHIIEPALVWGANILNTLDLDNDAPPVFLLDTNRLNRNKYNLSVFDNSWDIYDQDLPTYNYFIKHGIKKIIIKGDKINSDINKILYKFPKDKIKIYFTDGYEKPTEIKLKKPTRKELLND